jgi:hypothetical protein
VPAVVTLTTDFGHRDPWVGIMKGVILGVCRDVKLVDLTHEVAPHDTMEAALALEAAVRFFPPGTVHLAVVDPGVGGSRRGLVVESGNQRFVGPDNGVFTPALGPAGWRAFELTAPEYRRPEVSRTFHGRDLFAPAAGFLALGVAPERFGPPVTDPLRLPWPAALAVGDGWRGEVVHVDRFGNLITSLRADEVPAGAVVEIAGRALPLVATYAEAEMGAAAALIGSAGRLEVAVRQGSAATALGVGRGEPVLVRPRRSSASKM